MKSERPIHILRACRSSASPEICASSEDPGSCRATETTRSRTTPWSWRRASGFRTGSCAPFCGATCRRCCALCAPAPNSYRSSRQSKAGVRALAVLMAWMASGLALTACDREPPPPPPRVKQVFHLNPYEKDFGYSQAVLVDKTLYISGSVAADSDGRLVAPGDMAGQMRAAYSNVRRTLAAHGADFDEVVKETIYTTNMDALLKASDIRFEYYDKERLPTTSWVQVQRLVDPGFLVEIEVVAELP